MWRSRWALGLAPAAVLLAVGVVVLRRLMATFVARAKWADETGGGGYTTAEEFVTGALGLAAFSIGAVLAMVCLAQLFEVPISGWFVLIAAGAAVLVGGFGGIVIGGVFLMIAAGLAVTLAVQRIVRRRASGT